MHCKNDIMRHINNHYPFLDIMPPWPTVPPWPTPNVQDFTHPLLQIVNCKPSTNPMAILLHERAFIERNRSLFFTEATGAGGMTILDDEKRPYEQLSLSLSTGSILSQTPSWFFRSMLLSLDKFVHGLETARPIGQKNSLILVCHCVLSDNNAN
jgi:hypothetical protein